jgi:hypothetical protein
MIERQVNGHTHAVNVSPDAVLVNRARHSRSHWREIRAKAVPPPLAHKVRRQEVRGDRNGRRRARVNQLISRRSRICAARPWGMPIN